MTTEKLPENVSVDNNKPTDLSSPKLALVSRKAATEQAKGDAKTTDASTKKKTPIFTPTQLKIAGGVAAAVLVTTIGGIMYSSSQNAKAEKAAAEQAALIAQQQAEEQAKQQAKGPGPAIPEVLQTTVGLMQQQQPNHWIFVGPNEMSNPNITKDKLVRAAIETILSQDSRFVQGQGLKVNGTKALLSITDPRLSSRLSRVEQEVAMALSAYKFEVVTNDKSVPVVTHGMITDNTGRILETPEDFILLETNLTVPANMAWQKAVSEIDLDPTIANGEGILSLVREEQKPAEDTGAMDEMRRDYERRIEDMERVIQRADERLAEEVSNTRLAEQRLREQTVQVANIIQRIEDSPNAQNSLRAYDINKYLKSKGIKVESVVGDLVYIRDKDGEIIVRRLNDVVTLNGTTVQLAGVDDNTGMVMVVPKK